MSATSVEDVKSFVLAYLRPHMRNTSDVPDDFDVLGAGILDSLGIVELIGEVERRFALEIDFGELDPDQLTVIGPFCRYVAERSQRVVSTVPVSPRLSDSTAFAE